MARFGVLVILATVAIATVASGYSEINVVTPAWADSLGMITSRSAAQVGNRGADFESWPLTDGNLNTVVTVDTDQPTYHYRLIYEYGVKVNRYKLYVPKDTDPSLYPTAWTLTGENWSGITKVLVKVTNAKFVNGVYASKIPNDTKYEMYRLKFTEDSTPGDGRLNFKMAEIKYFGPRGQYDKWVGPAGFPCRKAPVYVRKKDGKTKAQGGVPFSSDTSLGAGALGRFFNDEFYDGQRITLRNRKMIIGYHFPEPLKVVQFGLDGSLLYSSRNPTGGIMKLEGHTCDPTCDYFGRDGWVSLARGSLELHYKRLLLVTWPGFYRAYRIRYDVRPEFRNFLYNVGEVHFLKCAEGDEI